MSLWLNLKITHSGADNRAERGVKSSSKACSAVYADKAHRVAILLIGRVALFASFEMVSAMSENAALS